MHPCRPGHRVAVHDGPRGPGHLRPAAKVRVPRHRSSRVAATAILVSARGDRARLEREDQIPIDLRAEDGPAGFLRLLIKGRREGPKLGRGHAHHRTAGVFTRRVLVQEQLTEPRAAASSAIATAICWKNFASRPRPEHYRINSCSRPFDAGNCRFSFIFQERGLRGAALTGEQTCPGSPCPLTAWMRVPSLTRSSACTITV